MKSCLKCGAADRYPSGACRRCARARVAGYQFAHPEGREDNARRVQVVLRLLPTTRAGLERALGMSQQRVSQALRDVGACVVGYAPADGKGQPAPIYALERRTAPRSAIGAVSSVWQLGSMA